MIRRLINIPIPFYLVIVFLILVGFGFVFSIRYFGGQKVYSYQFSLPQLNSSSTPLEYGGWPALANRDFFLQVKEDFITNEASFIEADLSAMKLNVYQGGKSVLQVDIKTKGREGSWWETPAGLYKIGNKEKNHYSSFGRVYMPWSMPFQGNFFIHGWPYYKNGTPVSSDYSGGCIRLTTADAEKVFTAATVGMPVLVYKEEFKGDNFGLRLQSPEVQASAYLVSDLNSNFVLAENNLSDPLSIASITKLMTAAVAVEYINMEKEITITPSMLVATSKPRLKTGQKISLYNLLPLLLMESSNEAAEAIAAFLGRSRFVDLMNHKASAIGMNKAYFKDPSGQDAGNIASPEDLFALARYLYHNRRFVLDATAGKIGHGVYGSLVYADLKNFNAFSDDERFMGGKVGKTDEAGKTMLVILNLSFGGTERPIVIILLNTQDYILEGKKLADWAQAAYIPIEAEN
ncbi:MAG: L,D-transpeptidase family protein [Candidatus Liptonbacteria bacterium]